MCTAACCFPSLRTGAGAPLFRTWDRFPFQALDGSPLAGLLKGWGQQLAIPRYSAFTRHGFDGARVFAVGFSGGEWPSRGSLFRGGYRGHRPPDGYGSPASSLTFAIDFLVRFRLLYAAAGHSSPSTSWRLSVRELYVAIDFMLATLVDDAVVRALAPT